MTAARTGDIAHAFIILNTTVFLAAVLLHAVGMLNVFSEAFQAQGFCIANFTAAVSSHELSFYSDTVFASAIFLLSRPYKSEPSMKPVIRAVPGILGHGVAHYHIGYHGRGRSVGAADGPQILSDTPPTTLAQGVVVVSIFFFLLFRASDGMSTRATAAQAVIHGAVTVLLVPPRFGFTYVQTALLLVFSLVELARAGEEKDVYWDAYAVLVGLPVGFVAWAEALTCEHGYRSLGGHVIYDTSISLSVLCYFICVRSGVLAARAATDAERTKQA